MEPKYLSEAETQKRDGAAGITEPRTAPITLLKKTTEELIADAKACGIEVTVSTRPKGTGEIVLLPGVHPPEASS